MGGIKLTKFTSQTDGPIFKFHEEKKTQKSVGKWEFLKHTGFYSEFMNAALFKPGQRLEGRAGFEYRSYD
jgi:hypothetical protein